MKLSLFAAATALMALAGCAPSAGVDGEAPAVSPVKITDDDFSPQEILVGPADNTSGFNANPSVTWFLRSFIDKKTHAVQTQLYVDASYLSGGWKFYEIATDDHAQIIALTSISNDVYACDAYLIVECHYREVFALSLERKSLEAAMPTGYRLKVSAKNGESIILTISPAQIRSQIEAIAASPYAGSRRL